MEILLKTYSHKIKVLFCKKNKTDKKVDLGQEALAGNELPKRECEWKKS